MISGLCPPWIHPTQTVRVLDESRKNFIQGFYCFKKNCWVNAKGQEIVIYGWLE